MPRIKVTNPTENCECKDCTSCPPLGPFPINSTEVDLKLQLLTNRITKTYLPKDLVNASDIELVKELSDLSDVDAYIYIDDNGKPTKILATTVLKKEIS